jgi:hypothetical protein
MDVIKRVVAKVVSEPVIIYSAKKITDPSRLLRRFLMDKTGHVKLSKAYIKNFDAKETGKGSIRIKCAEPKFNVTVPKKFFTENDLKIKDVMKLIKAENKKKKTPKISKKTPKTNKVTKTVSPERTLKPPKVKKTKTPKTESKKTFYEECVSHHNLPMSWNGIVPRDFPKKFGYTQMEYVGEWKIKTSSQIDVILNKFDEDDLVFAATSFKKAAALSRRRKIYGLYYFVMGLTKKLEPLIVKKRSKSKKKVPNTFYSIDTPSSYGPPVGKVLIYPNDSGALKEFNATPMNLSGGKRGIAISDRRFKTGDKVWVKGRYGREIATIVSIKEERTKSGGGTMWRYYYGTGKAWFRDVFEEGQSPVKKAE